MAGHPQLVVLLFAVSIVASGQNAGSTEVKDKREILGLEQSWGDAVSKKDAAPLKRVLADDWIGRYPFYTLTKAQELEEIKSGAIRVESVTTSEMKIRLFGNSAIVTGKDVEKQWYKGRDVSGTYLWMDVFVKREGRWQAVASQETLVMK